MSTISSPTGQQLPEEAIGILSADGFFDRPKPLKLL